MPKPPNGYIYGEWAVSLPPIEVEHADEVLGARILLDSQGRPEFVEMQWRSSDGVHQVRIDWLNAMMLLSLLKCIQLDLEWPFPLDPRDPNWRAGDGKP